MGFSSKAERRAQAQAAQSRRQLEAVQKKINDLESQTSEALIPDPEPFVLDETAKLAEPSNNFKSGEKRNQKRTGGVIPVIFGWNNVLLDRISPITCLAGTSRRDGESNFKAFALITHPSVLGVGDLQEYNVETGGITDHDLVDILWKLGGGAEFILNPKFRDKFLLSENLNTQHIFHFENPGGNLVLIIRFVFLYKDISGDSIASDDHYSLRYKIASTREGLDGASIVSKTSSTEGSYLRDITGSAIQEGDRMFLWNPDIDTEITGEFYLSVYAVGLKTFPTNTNADALWLHGVSAFYKSGDYQINPGVVFYNNNISQYYHWDGVTDIRETVIKKLRPQNYHTHLESLLLDILQNPYYGMNVPDNNLDISWTQDIDMSDFSTIIDRKIPLWELITQVCRFARCTPILENNVLNIVQDVSNYNPVALFNDENIIQGSFSYDLRSFDDSIESGYKVNYYSEDNEQLSVFVDVDGVNDDIVEFDEVTLLGCKSQEKAITEGKYLSRTKKYRRKIIKFTTDQIGQILSFGDVICVTHSSALNIICGRIESIFYYTSSTRASMMLSTRENPGSGSTREAYIMSEKGVMFPGLCRVQKFSSNPSYIIAPYYVRAGNSRNYIHLSQNIQKNNNSNNRFSFEAKSYISSDITDINFFSPQVSARGFGNAPSTQPAAQKESGLGSLITIFKDQHYPGVGHGATATSPDLQYEYNESTGDYEVVTSTVVPVKDKYIIKTISYNSNGTTTITAIEYNENVYREY